MLHNQPMASYRNVKKKSSFKHFFISLLSIGTTASIWVYNMYLIDNLPLPL